MKTLYFKKGEEIICEGTLSDCAYIVVSGTVEVSKKANENKKQVIGILKDNDIFGEMGLIDGLPRSATVTALEDCSINIFSKESFESLIERNPEALMPILKILASRLRSTLNMVDELQLRVDKGGAAASSF